MLIWESYLIKWILNILKLFLKRVTGINIILVIGFIVTDSMALRQMIFIIQNPTLEHGLILREVTVILPYYLLQFVGGTVTVINPVQQEGVL